jgi:ATP-binding cassette subfamily C protein LapB
MIELLRRLLFRPLLFGELIIISFFINLLALAPTLFVIQLFNRYLAHGVQGTLVTLTAGVLIAISLEVIFRWLRQHIAAAISARPNRHLAVGSFDAMLGVKNTVIAAMPVSAKQEIMRGVNKIHDAYTAANIITFLDLPFSFLILLVLYLLSPQLAIIALIGISFIILSGFFGQLIIHRPSRRLLDLSVKQNALVNTIAQFSDMVRVFNGHRYFRQLWQNDLLSIHTLKHSVANRAAGLQNITAMTGSLMTVGIISTGAVQVVSGDLTIGSLIGANILAARALMPAVRFISLAPQLTQSKQAMKSLKELSRLPKDPVETATLKKFKGRLELKDVALVFPGSPVPLFESLSLKIDPGFILAVIGPNGSGKTTLARIIAGLLEPNRGQVLVDGVSLTQLSHKWWRSQIIYLPQEAMFFTGTLKDNILLNNNRLSSAQINHILEQSDLKNHMDTSPKGLNTLIHQNGQTTPLGIRRRLAIARSLVTNGRLVIFDEPTEGLDTAGQQAVYHLLNQFTEKGKTIIVFSHDRNILKGASMVLDLGIKPVPQATRIHRTATADDATGATQKTKKERPVSSRDNNHDK